MNREMNMKKSTISPKPQNSRKVLQEIPQNALHHHMSLKIQKSISKKLKFGEEAENQLNFSRKEPSTVKNLNFKSVDVSMQQDEKVDF